MQKLAYLWIKLAKCNFTIVDSCMQSQRNMKHCHFHWGAFIILNNNCSLPPSSDCCHQNGKPLLVLWLHGLWKVSLNFWFCINLWIKLAKCDFTIIDSYMQSQHNMKHCHFHWGAFIILNNNWSLPLSSDCCHQNGKTTFGLMVARTLKSKFEFLILHQLISWKYLWLMEVTYQYQFRALIVKYQFPSSVRVPVSRLCKISISRLYMVSVFRLCKVPVSRLCEVPVSRLCKVPVSRLCKVPIFRLCKIPVSKLCKIPIFRVCKVRVCKVRVSRVCIYTL